MATRKKKYHPEMLLPMFRKAAQLRNEMISAGFTDNGGAIHSAERILNILAICIKYPKLNHMNNYRYYAQAKFSVDAHAAHRRGEKILIEHVAPHREFTRQAIKLVTNNASDGQLQEFIDTNFELVLLTEDETRRLNRRNRSRIDPERLLSAGIQLVADV